MNVDIARALSTDRVIDITTTGRVSGTPHRIEIWFFRVGDDLYLTGAPGAVRAWYRNLEAEPDFTVHLKQSLEADLPARAHRVTEPAEREAILRAILAGFTPVIPPEWMPGRTDAERQATETMFAAIQADPDAVLPQWLAESPLVRIELK